MNYHLVDCDMQGWTLLLIGPVMDRYITGNWVMNYEWNVPAIMCLAVSCTCAVGVNVSQFLCLGRFSAVSYQVAAAFLVPKIWLSSPPSESVQSDTLGDFVLPIPSRSWESRLGQTASLKSLGCTCSLFGAGFFA